MMTDEKMSELFARYKETGDVAIRNQIAEKYLYIADILAKKFTGRGVEYDDLRQVAALALIRGIDRFDSDMGMQFSTFITPTITGEIKNYFRDKSRSVKVPRKLGEQSMLVRKFSERFQSENGVKPSVKEIATALSLTEEEVVEALEVGGTVSLDRLASKEDEEGGSLYDVLPTASDEFDEFETKEALRAAMKDFTDMEKALIKYRYMDGLSQEATAEKLKVSQMYVSRTQRKLLKRLREILKDSI